MRLQRGPDGESFLDSLDPSFFVGAVAAGVAATATWETFKAAFVRVVQALRHLPGPSNVADLLSEGDELQYDIEEMLRRVWQMASGITKGEAGHGIEEAHAFQAILVTREILRSQHYVKLSVDHYEALSQAGGALAERLTPTQLLARIIEEWIRKNPNATIGLMK